MTTHTSLTVHPSATIYDGATIHDSVEIGPGAVIGPDVKVGKGTRIGPHVVIDGCTEIGEDCHIYAGASIGLDPQDKSYKGERTGVIIGDRSVIREYATIHKATGEGFTIIGEEAFIMNYSHVAHNCRLGKGVVMANGSTCAGYVEVGDYAVFSGFVVLHQHIRVGTACMLSGLTGARQDLPPFTTLDGRPCKVRGVNMLGLRRMKVGAKARTAIKEAYRLIYRSGLNQTNALARVEEEIEDCPEVKEIVDFFRTSKRGVVPSLMQEGSGDSTYKETGVMSEGGEDF